MNATKNYMTNGGNELVIGGKLTILEGAEVEGLEGGGTEVTPAESVSTLSNAAELSDVIGTVNQIITNLKAAGLMA